jgi:hypothetical protein
MPAHPDWDCSSFWTGWTDPPWGHGIGPPPPGCDDPVRIELSERYQQLTAELAQVLRPVSQPGFHTIPGEGRPADGICEVTGPLARCSAAVAWHIWLGCVQEHLVECEVCERHMGLIENEAMHNFCRPCRKHNEVIRDMTPQADETVQILRKVEAQHDQPG